MRRIIKYLMASAFTIAVLLSQTECYGMAPSPQGMGGETHGSGGFLSSLGPGVADLILILVMIVVGILLGRILIHRVDMGQRKIVGVILFSFGIGLFFYRGTTGDPFVVALVALILAISGGMLLFSKGKKV